MKLFLIRINQILAAAAFFKHRTRINQRFMYFYCRLIRWLSPVHSFSFLILIPLITVLNLIFVIPGSVPGLLHPRSGLFLPGLLHPRSGRLLPISL